MPCSRFAWVDNPMGKPTACKFDPEEIEVKNALIVYSLNVDEIEMNITELSLKYPYKEIE